LVGGLMSVKSEVIEAAQASQQAFNKIQNLSLFNYI